MADNVLQPTKVHVIERNAMSYDISTALGILGLATFLIKLRVELVPQIHEKLGDAPREYLQGKGIPVGGKSMNSDRAAWRKSRVKLTSE